MNKEMITYLIIGAVIGFFVGQSGIEIPFLGGTDSGRSGFVADYMIEIEDMKPCADYSKQIPAGEDLYFVYQGSYDIEIESCNTVDRGRRICRGEDFDFKLSSVDRVGKVNVGAEGSKGYRIKGFDKICTFLVSD